MVKVTVAMPAYNAAEYICEAIESVLAQDFEPFELLIVDDASRDDTRRLLKRYSKHPGVRIFQNRRNVGSGATRNKLLRLARGEYITPCDADDLLLPGALGRFSRYLDEHPRVGAVYGDILELMTDRRKSMVRAPQICGKDYRQAWDLIENAVNHAGSMIRKSLMLRVGGYDECVYSVDDYSLWLKLAEMTRFKYMRGEIYYVWRRHPDSLTQTDKYNDRDVEKIQREAIQRRYGREMRGWLDSSRSNTKSDGKPE